MTTTTIPAQATDLTVTVTSVPTQVDAQLVVQLGQLAASMNVDRGQSLLWKHYKAGGLTYAAFEAAYPPGDSDGIAILNVLKWHETLATLVKQGLLNQGLVLDWLWVSGTWDTCREIALGQRAESGSDAIWENFEALAAAQTC